MVPAEVERRLHMPFVFQMYDREGQPKGPASSCDFIPAANAGASFHGIDTPEPSTRAALVLSAVGCNWRRGGL